MHLSQRKLNNEDNKELSKEIVSSFWLSPFSFTILPVPWKHLLENNIVLIITQPVQPGTEQMKNRKNWPWQTYFTILYLIFWKKQTNKQLQTQDNLPVDAWCIFLDPNWVCNNNKPFFYRSTENVKLFEMHNVLWIHEFSFSGNRTASSSKCDEVWSCNLKTLVCTYVSTNVKYACALLPFINCGDYFQVNTCC